MGAHLRAHEAIAQHLLAGLDGREQEQLVALLTKVATHAARPSQAQQGEPHVHR